MNFAFRIQQNCVPSGRKSRNSEFSARINDRFISPTCSLNFDLSTGFRSSKSYHGPSILRSRVSKHGSINRHTMRSRWETAQVFQIVTGIFLPFGRRGNTYVYIPTWESPPENKIHMSL